MWGSAAYFQANYKVCEDTDKFYSMVEQYNRGHCFFNSILLAYLESHCKHVIKLVQRP